MRIIDTQRLSFRLLDEQDSEDLLALDDDPEVMKFINGGKASTPKDIHEVFIPRLNRYTNYQLGHGLWGCYTIENHKFIGWVLIRPLSFAFPDEGEEQLEIGWRFKRETWGKGYATEAAKHIIASLEKQELSQHAFQAIAHQDNRASIKVMEKLGMTFYKSDVHQDPNFPVNLVFYRKPITV